MTRPAVHTKTMSYSNKRLKETQIDRLSELPDSLIIRILSLLEVKQSAVTVVLAKRYRYLWRESPRLVFIEESQSPGIIRDFVARVNRTLLVISGVNRNGVKAFEIRFLYTKIYCSNVDVWFDFAIRNNVKQLSVLLQCARQCVYSLPQMMFNNSNFKRLSLRACVLAPRRKIEWQSLSELTIGYVELPEHVIGNILSGCPVLYFLFIMNCWGFDSLEVESKSVYKLFVFDTENELNCKEPVLQISALYIHILGVKLDRDGRKVSLGNISSLVSATIECVGSDLDIDIEEEMDNVKELLEKIRHVKMVGIAVGYNRILSSLAKIGYRFPQTARTWMSVRALTKMRSIHGIIGQLESSPNLEKLVIDGFCIEKKPSFVRIQKAN